MGRRKDDPAVQAAKGFPGRRRKKVLEEIEAAAEAAERDGGRGEPFAIPAALSAAPVYWRRAIRLWETLSETLLATGRRRPGYRGALTRYCMWMQIHESAADQLRRDCPKGDFIIDWTPVNGTTRKIPHPALKIMSDAEPILRALEGEFGFTPRADSDLVRVETFNQSQMKLPFGARPAPQSPQPSEPEDDPMDLMTSLDSSPPPTMN